MIQPWTERFRIRSYECSVDGRLSLTALANYLQEVAGNHARELGLALGQIGRLTWVLHRLRIQTTARPQWGEDVDILTWPSGHDGLAATREFNLIDARGDIFGGASSHWLLLDLDRRRPVRLPETVTTLTPPDLPLPLPAPARLPEPADDELLRLRVQKSDLDMNGHVNNVRYLEWMMNAVNDPFGLSAVDIQFKSEAMLGDELSVRGSLDDGARGIRRNDGRLLAQAQLA